MAAVSSDLPSQRAPNGTLVTLMMGGAVWAAGRRPDEMPIATTATAARVNRMCCTIVRCLSYAGRGALLRREDRLPHTGGIFDGRPEKEPPPVSAVAGLPRAPDSISRI